MKNRSASSFPILYALLLIAALVLTMFGATIYEKITLARDENNALRSTLAYVQTRVQAADGSGEISVTESNGGSVLNLAEGDSGFVTRIYLSDGMLCEELNRAASPLTPELANALTAAESFSVEKEEGLLHITVDGHRALIALRAGE